MLLKKKTVKGLSFILTISILGTGTFSYIPTVHAESNQPPSDQENQLSNTLSKLEIEGIPLDQAFSANVNTYSAFVENEVDSIQLQVEAASPNSSITINDDDQTVTNGNSGPISLQTGENIILITVNDGTNPPNTYTLTITRKKNANNLLQDIKLSNGQLSPHFDSAATEYNVEVANEVDSLTVIPEAVEKTTSMKVNDILAASEGVSVNLPIGKSDITITNTAENGDQKTYFIHVIRAAIQNNQPPGSDNTRPSTNTTSGNNTRTGLNSRTGNIARSKTNGTYSGSNSTQQNSGSVQKASTAALSSFTVSEGTWDSSFSTNEYTYHIALPSNVQSVTLNPVAEYSSAAISIEGSSSKGISLSGSKTVIPIVVTNGEDRKTYVLVFDKPVQQTNGAAVTAQQTTDTNLTNPSATVTSIVSGTTELKTRKTKNTTSFLGKIAAFFKRIFS